MATVQNIIDRAMRLINQLNPGTSANTTESADALVSLNAMYGKWRNEGLTAFAKQAQAIPLVAGNQTRTIGPTGNLVTTRPTEISSAYVVINGLSYEVQQITAGECAMISLKDLTGEWPFQFYYQPNMPDGTIFLWPVPSAASTLFVVNNQPLLEFATVSDVLSVPPGMEEAMATNLAISISPEYGYQVTPVLMKMAADSLRVLKRTNNKTPRVYFDHSLYGYRGGVPYYPPYP